MLMISQYHLLDRKDAAIRDKKTSNNNSSSYTSHRLSLPLIPPKRPMSKPPQPSPRTSAMFLTSSQQEEEDLAKAIQLSLLESKSKNVAEVS